MLAVASKSGDGGKGLGDRAVVEGVGEVREVDVVGFECLSGKNRWRLVCAN